MIEVVPFNKTVTAVKTASPQGERAVMWAYAYHVGDILFDAGCANAEEELHKYAAKRRLERVMVTHAHEDHYGGCAAFISKASIFAEPVSKKVIQEPPELPEFFQFVWGQPKPIESVEALPQEFSVEHFHFEAIPLPGHCEGMVGFFEVDQGWLFSADAVPLPSQKQMAMPEENVPQMIATMEHIQSMDVKVLFDGHRGPIRDPTMHIQTRIDYLQGLQQQVQQLHAEGKTLSEIQAILAFPEPWYLPSTKGRFAIEYLIKSLLEDVK